MALFEHITKFIDDLESAEAAPNALEEILWVYPPALDMNDAMVPPSFSSSDLPPTSPPHAASQDIFGDFMDYATFETTLAASQDISGDIIDYTTFEDAPTPDLVTGASTNPSPESTSDHDHPHTGRAGSSPRIFDAETEDAFYLLHPTVWPEIADGDQLFHRAQE